MTEVCFVVFRGTIIDKPVCITDGGLLDNTESFCKCVIFKSLYAVCSIIQVLFPVGCIINFNVDYESIGHRHVTILLN